MIMFYKRCFGYINLLLAFNLAFATNLFLKHVQFQALESPLGHYPIQSKYKQGKRLQWKKDGWKWKMNLRIDIKLGLNFFFVQRRY